MEKKPNSALNIDSPLNKNFFRLWLEFLKPFHRLTDRETDVLAAFLKERYFLSKKISDPELLDKITMGEDTKKRVREACNMSSTHFQVIMTKLKKSKVIDNGKISPKLIPKITEEDGVFQLLLLFNLK